jgi:putative ABC transport system permease protein
LRSASTCPPLADAMMSEISEVESVLRLTSGGKPVIRYEEKVFVEDKVFFTESNFFEFFSFKLISGNAKTALKEQILWCLQKRRGGTGGTPMGDGRVS